MKTKLMLLTVSAVLLAGTLKGQSQPVYFQTINCIKIEPGKRMEYLQFVNEAGKKLAEMRANASEIVSWTLLRSVMPAGSEARCDYMISTIYDGAPPAPPSAAALGSALQKAGVKLTAAEFRAKLTSLSRLVATEMWRPRIRVGQPQKGHYLFLNYMKVHDAPEYIDFENNIWRPMAEEWVKEGSQSGWVFSTKMLPYGTETPYAAYSADIFPSWEAAFKVRPAQATFQKVHPGKNFQQTMTNRLGKLRDLARRELFVVEERVAKQ